MRIECMNKLASVAVLATLGGLANAQTLLFYSNFNDTSSAAAHLTASTNLVGGVYTVSGATPAGTLTSPTDGTYGSFAGTTLNARGGAVAGGSFVVVGSSANGATLTLQFNSTGWQNLVLMGAMRNTGTGFNDIDIDLSTDGGSSWSSVINNVAPLGTSYALNVNTGLGAGATNQSDVRVRWTFNGATNASGNMRLDNVTIEGDELVPEPASMTVLGLGLVAALRRKQKK